MARAKFNPRKSFHPRKTGSSSLPAEPSAMDCQNLIVRAWQVAERELEAIEGRAGESAGQRGASLAAFLKGLRELIELDPLVRPALTEPEPPPRDLDTLRTELTRRIERLRADTDAPFRRIAQPCRTDNARL